MPPKKTAINGCGRIGRLALRLAWARSEELEIVHVNKNFLFYRALQRVASKCTCVLLMIWHLVWHFYLWMAFSSIHMRSGAPDGRFLWFLSRILCS